MLCYLKWLRCHSILPGYACLPVTNTTHGLQCLQRLNIEIKQEVTALMFTRCQNGESLIVLVSMVILAPMTVPFCHPSRFPLVLPLLQPLTQCCLRSWSCEATCQPNKKHFHCMLEQQQYRSKLIFSLSSPWVSLADTCTKLGEGDN